MLKNIFWVYAGTVIFGLKTIVANIQHFEIFFQFHSESWQVGSFPFSLSGSDESENFFYIDVPC